MQKRVERYAKLDNYDYSLTKDSNGKVEYVVIVVDSSVDVVIADISSEITGADGNIYVEGHYLKLVKMVVGRGPERTYLTIEVEEK